MANKKTPPKKTAAKNTSDQRSSSQKTSARGAGAERKRKASRPPVIDLKADEVVDKSTSAVSEQKEEKKKEKAEGPSQQKEHVKAGQQKEEQARSKPPKTPLIAAGLAGLIAGTGGGLVAGLILTGTQVDTAQSPEFANLKDRVNRIEVGQKKSAPPPELLTRLDQAESDTRFLNTQIKTLQGDIIKLKDQLTVFAGKIIPSNENVQLETPPVVDVSGLEARIAELQSQLKERTTKASELSAQITAMQKTVADQQAALNETVKKAEGSAQKSDQTAAGLQKAYADLEKNVDDKIEKLYQAGGDNRIRAAALSLSWRQLTDVVQGSKPFTKELAAVQSLIGKQQAVEDMEQLAVSGVPDIEALKTEFAEIKISASEEKPTPDDGTLLDKIMSNAKSVVRVRKIGEGQKTQSDPLDTLKEKLRINDLDGVIKAFEGLNDQNKLTYQNWMLKVEKRNNLNRSMGALQNVILAEIGKATEPEKAGEGEAAQ